MAYEIPGRIISLEAGADLSTHIYKFMTLATDGQVDPSGDGANSVGVLQNKPDAAGKVASIMSAGIAKVIAGGAIDEGERVTSDSSGYAVDTVAEDEYVLGVALTPVAGSGELVSVLLSIPGNIPINKI